MITAQDNATAFTPVATVRSPVRVVLHVAQVHRPFAALTRAAHDFDVVYEIALHLQIIDYLLNVIEDALQCAQTIDVVVQTFLLVPLDKRLCL